MWNTHPRAQNMGENLHNRLLIDLLVGRGMTLQQERPIGPANPCKYVQKILNSQLKKFFK